MKRPRITRILAFFVSLSLACSNPALALRQLEPIENSGLEENLAYFLGRSNNSPGSRAGLEEKELEELLRRVGQGPHGKDKEVSNAVREIRKILKDLSPKERRFVERFGKVEFNINSLHRELDQELDQEIYFAFMLQKDLRLLQRRLQEYRSLIRQKPYVPGTQIPVVGVHSPTQQDLKLLALALAQLKEVDDKIYRLTEDFTLMVSLGTQSKKAHGSVSEYFPGVIHLRWPYPGKGKEQVDNLMATWVHEARHHFFFYEYPEEEILTKIGREIEFTKKEASPLAGRHRDLYTYLLEIDAVLEQIKAWIQLADSLNDQPARQKRVRQWVRRDLRNVLHTLQIVNARKGTFLIEEKPILTFSGEILYRLTVMEAIHLHRTLNPSDTAAGLEEIDPVVKQLMADFRTTSGPPVNRFQLLADRLPRLNPVQRVQFLRGLVWLSDPEVPPMMGAIFFLANTAGSIRVVRDQIIQAVGEDTAGDLSLSLRLLLSNLDAALAEDSWKKFYEFSRTVSRRDPQLPNIAELVFVLEDATREAKIRELRAAIDKADWTRQKKLYETMGAIYREKAQRYAGFSSERYKQLVSTENALGGLCYMIGMEIEDQTSGSSPRQNLSDLKRDTDRVYLRLQATLEKGYQESSRQNYPILALYFLGRMMELEDLYGAVLDFDTEGGRVGQSFKHFAAAGGFREEIEKLKIQQRQAYGLTDSDPLAGLEEKVDSEKLADALVDLRDSVFEKGNALSVALASQDIIRSMEPYGINRGHILYLFFGEWEIPREELDERWKQDLRAKQNLLVLPVAIDEIQEGYHATSVFKTATVWADRYQQGLSPPARVNLRGRNFTMSEFTPLIDRAQTIIQRTPSEQPIPVAVDKDWESFLAYQHRVVDQINQEGVFKVVLNSNGRVRRIGMAYDRPLQPLLEEKSRLLGKSPAYVLFCQSEGQMVAMNPTLGVVYVWNQYGVCQRFSSADSLQRVADSFIEGSPKANAKKESIAILKDIGRAGGVQAVYADDVRSHPRLPEGDDLLGNIRIVLSNSQGEWNAPRLNWT